MGGWINDTFEIQNMDKFSPLYACPVGPVVSFYYNKIVAKDRHALCSHQSFRVNVLLQSVGLSNLGLFK